MTKKISVIIPCYNTAQFIDRCIESLVYQTIGIENLELIFVNDASTDDTLTHLTHYENLYPDSILVINSEVNRKQGGARNIGLEYASADYIGFVDADDWIELSMYEKLYQKAIEYDCDMVTCHFKRDPDKDVLIMGKTKKIDSFYQITDEKSRKQFITSDFNTGGVCTKIYKKSFIIDNTLYFPEQTAYEDNFFIILTKFYIKSFYIVEEFLYHYYININSTTMLSNSPLHFQRLSVTLSVLQEIQTRSLFETYKEEIEFLFIKLYFMASINIFFTRFSPIPADIFPTMQKTVLHLFPKCLENFYWNQDSLKSAKDFLTTTLNPSLTKEDWLKFAANYNQQHLKNTK